MIIPLLLLYSFSVSAYGIDPSAVYLYSRKSFVNYTAEHWKLHEAPANEITVALNYQLKSNGQIFAIRLIEPNDGQQSFKLSISVFDTRYIVALMDVNDNPIEQGFVDLGIQLEGNHTLYTKIANGAVSLVLDEKQSDNSVLDNALIHLRKDDTISFVIGGGGESATGCVQFKHLAVDGALTLPKDLHEVELNYVDTCNAVQDCKNRHCGAGKCVQLEVAECDCFGTRKTGPNCKDEPRDIRLKNDDDTANPELIRFNTWDQQAIERIILYFEYADPTDKEGVLLHSILANGTQFKLYVVNNKGQLTAGSAHLNFTLDSETKVHKVEIEIGTKISLTVDGTVKTCATPLGMLLSSLTIGGVQSDLPDGTREIGITACFPLIYVDHYDVIDLYFKGDSKVISQSKLSSCSDEPLVSDGIKMFDTDKFQVVQMSDDLNSDSMEGLNLYEAFTKTLSTSNNCERADQHVCRHDSICEKHNTTIKCSCKPGYGGRYCQFVLMPRTCSEAQLWKLPEGPTRLDLDGPGKLSANIAMCKNGTTIVPHDMPSSTSIRDSAFLTDSLFLISYRDFTPHQLSSLVRQSYDCSQTVAYSCNKAPLSFSSYHTWFHTAYTNKTLRQMGQVPNSCACMDTGCVGHGKCNCDSGSITQDTGILTGKTAGITRVIALRDEGQVAGQMTLGELQCWGNDGTAIKFNTLNALPLEDWNGQALSFHFATVNSTALLAEIYEPEKSLYIKIVEGHTIELSYSGGTLVAHSQARLNDSQWHSLVLEVVESEIRLSVDGIHAFKAIESDILPNGQLKISCTNDGFIGAIRDVRINGEFVNLYQHISGILGVDRYNGGRCSETRCQNGAICVEDFVNDSFLCRCKYPNIHSGKSCEIDLNRESSISLHGGNIRLDESSSPLAKQTVLSFRTDQHNALIFFAHDENNNFVQLHLSNEVNITLTLNNEDVVSSCTVSALMGKEFANMEWIQISIEHKPEYSTLIVEEDACVIRESRQLATKPIKKYSHVETDIAIIPVGLHPVVDVKPFVYTFIGGVEREETARDGSMVLEPLYQSPIHNLRGCVRGLKIGDEVVNLREKITENHLGVRSGCDITCVDCHNGGHCAADWTNPVKQPLVPACDCARTSYEGLSCNIDNGMHIPDDSSFTFRTSPILRRIIASRKGRQEIRFAFAVEKSTALLKSRQFPSKRSLANVHFTDTSYFEFVINKNLTLNVGYVDINGQIRVLNFDENFADGYRHFIRMRFGEKNRTIITVDTLTSTFTHPAENTAPNLFDVDRIQFAVARETELVPPSQAKQPFKGCISNVALDFYKNPPLILQPLSYFFNDTHEYHEFATSSGEVSPGKCSSFQSPDFLTGQKNPVELAEWDTNFARLDYTGPIMQMPEDEGSSCMLLWWIILIVFLILLALLIAFCIYKMLCKKDNESGRPFETEPLHRPKATKNIYSPPPLVNDPKSNYQVPEPHVNLDGEHPSDHSSLYDNRDTDNDSDTIRHIDDDDIVIVDRPNGVHNTPHRVSSFRGGDPTVPQGSPLYSPSSSRPTVIPIPPPRLETPIRSST